MKRKPLREKIDDSIDYAALGFTAIVGIGLVLLRGRIASRFNRRYGDSDEYDNSSTSCSTDADRGDDSNSSCNEK